MGVGTWGNTLTGAGDSVLACLVGGTAMHAFLVSYLLTPKEQLAQ